MKHILTTPALVLLLAVSLFSPLVSHAQDTEGIEIRPALIEERVDPGERRTFYVSVKNVTDAERTFFLGVADIRGVNEFGAPVFAENGQVTDYSLSQWVTFKEGSVSLQAGETKDVGFTVEVPEQASPGSHFGSVFFDSQPPQVGVTGSGVGIRVGNIISLRIAGDITESMRLREFSTEKFIYDAPPVTFTTTLENLGNVLVRPNGLIEITDMFGREVGKVEVNETGASTFPMSERSYQTIWNHDGFAIGRYQALMSVVYGEDERKTVTGVTSFWVLPLMPILTVLGIILALVISFYVLMKMYIAKKLRDMGVTAQRGDSAYYARRYNRSSSRLMFFMFLVFVLCLLGLVVLFLLFA